MINNNIEFIKKFDLEIGNIIQHELDRQIRNIELIASENFVSEQVMVAMGTVLTNKYAEGYPNKRYYGGCEFVDLIEDIAISRLKKIYKADHANVQPHSGAQANMAVYSALCEPGDTMLGMSLTHGGHLTHGSPVNQSGQLYNIIPYYVDRVTEMLDYDLIRKLAKKHKPKVIIAGASAYTRQIRFDIFKDIADEVGSFLMVDMAHIAGLVAAEQHMSPVPYADVITTTTHKTLRGPRGGAILCKKELASKIDKAVFPGTQGGPLMHVIAAKAICFGEALTENFVNYQKQIIKNAKALELSLKNKGIDLISNGTDNHMLLLNLSKLNITGKELQRRLDEVYITVNKNTIPYDTQSPFITSGIRIGTPAVTSRNMKEKEMEYIADLIYQATLNNFDNKINEIQMKVINLCNRFPLY